MTGTPLDLLSAVPGHPVQLLGGGGGGWRERGLYGEDLFYPLKKGKGPHSKNKMAKPPRFGKS